MCEFCNKDVNKRVKNISDENDEMRLNKSSQLEVAAGWQHGFTYAEFNIKYCAWCGGIGTIKKLVGYARYDAGALTKKEYIECPKCKGMGWVNESK
ncbi:hypothetical protein M3H67_000539 [Listeria monocytogenes]|nr:hypothetical protein [Listeria monocytogenes]